MFLPAYPVKPPRNLATSIFFSAPLRPLWLILLSPTPTPSSTTATPVSSSPWPRRSHCKLPAPPPAIPARRLHPEAHRSPRYAHASRAAHCSSAPFGSRQNCPDPQHPSSP